MSFINYEKEWFLLAITPVNMHTKCKQIHDVYIIYINLIENA